MDGALGEELFFMHLFVFIFTALITSAKIVPLPFAKFHFLNASDNVCCESTLKTCLSPTKLCRVPNESRALGLRTKINRAPGSREIDQRIPAPLCVFALIHKQILELRKYSNFCF